MNTDIVAEVLSFRIMLSYKLILPINRSWATLPYCRGILLILLLLQAEGRTAFS